MDITVQKTRGEIICSKCYITRYLASFTAKIHTSTQKVVYCADIKGTTESHIQNSMKTFQGLTDRAASANSDDN